MLVKKNKGVRSLSEKGKNILKKGKKDDRVQSSDSFGAVAKTISWPSFPSALLLAVRYILVSIAAGALFYLYDFGINQIISLIS